MQLTDLNRQQVEIPLRVLASPIVGDAIRLDGVVVDTTKSVGRWLGVYLAGFVCIQRVAKSGQSNRRYRDRECVVR